MVRYNKCVCLICNDIACVDFNSRMITGCLQAFWIKYQTGKCDSANMAFSID